MSHPHNSRPNLRRWLTGTVAAAITLTPMATAYAATTDEVIANLTYDAAYQTAVAANIESGNFPAIPENAVRGTETTQFANGARLVVFALRHSTANAMIPTDIWVVNVDTNEVLDYINVLTRRGPGSQGTTTVVVGNFHVRVFANNSGIPSSLDIISEAHVVTDPPMSSHQELVPETAKYIFE